MRDLALRSMLLAGLIGLAGCATTEGQKPTVLEIDPWQSWNRKVYTFNERMDDAILKPVATLYSRVVPSPIRRGVSNFFYNVSDVWSAANNFLQGKFASGIQDVVRVSTNTVFGLGGVLDVASEFGATRQGEDFGQTLGRWGVAPGPYLVWPLLGPSTFRDSLALPLDRSITPGLWVSDLPTKYALFTVQVVNERTHLLGASRLLEDIALDKYTFVRDAYLQRRRSLVYDGDIPESAPEEDYSDPDPDPDPELAPAPVEPAASEAAQ